MQSFARDGALLRRVPSGGRIAAVFSRRTTGDGITAAGKPIDISCNEAKIYSVYWVIARASKHIAARQKFIEFASRAEQQAG